MLFGPDMVGFTFQPKSILGIRTQYPSQEYWYLISNFYLIFKTGDYYSYESEVSVAVNVLFLTIFLASSQAVFIIESIMEHVAKELKMTPEAVRKVNFYKNGQVSCK